MNPRRTVAACLAAAALLAAPATAGTAATPGPTRPLPTGWLPANPYMSTSGANSMHADTYASDTHPFSGPVGHDTTVQFSGKGPCAGMGVTKEKLLLLQCGGAQNFTLRLIDPK